MKIVQLGANKASDDLSDHLLLNYEDLEFGLFVEANKLHIDDIKECYKKYKNVIVENIAIKTPLQEQDVLTMYYHTNEHPNYGITSCDINHLKKHVEVCPHLWGGEIKSFDVPCITLENLFSKYSIVDLDWLYIDVEGIDAELLLTFNWKKYNIKRIEFENLHLGHYKDSIRYMMLGMGYTQVESLHEYDWAFEKIEKLVPSESIDLKVLFFGRESKKDVWEYDFILNDILPQNLNKSIDFMSLEEVRNSSEEFDVFVYSARYPNLYPWGYMPTYNETLECVLKTKPKIIIQLSDEFYYEDLQDHNGLANYCDLFLRQYHHPNYTYTSNTLHIPLGYANGCKPHYEEKKYKWSFLGELKSDRQEMIDAFSKIPDHFIGGGLSKDEMCRIYAQSIFVPCGRGNSSLDCFRQYEASMNESIPVVVATKEEIENTFKYEQNPPWIFAENWDDAVQICLDLLKNPKELKEHQNKLYIWWAVRVLDIELKVDKVLADADYVDKDKLKRKLKNFPPVNFISIEEYSDRINFLYEKFNDYGIGNVTPHIFKKYDDEDHIITGNTAHTLLGSGRGPVTSHLKAIKDWYFNTDEEYAFFCEDDISFETVRYWNFTWDQFFNNLPKDWECVQLSWIRENTIFEFSTEGLKLRNRCWCDWSACAYLIKRSHAKKLINHYYKDGNFTIDYVGNDASVRPDWALRPVSETIIFSSFHDNSRVYGFPLFVEDVVGCRSSLHQLNQTRCYNLTSYKSVMDWWKEVGKELDIYDIIDIDKNVDQ
jgi:GR25 family glycosyltransferase involved in LPS biosynthesis